LLEVGGKMRGNPESPAIGAIFHTPPPLFTTPASDIGELREGSGFSKAVEGGHRFTIPTLG
jgi:hypothetical protein